jgi:DNA-binding MarR family transcriptional regulator
MSLHGIFFQITKQARADLDRWLRKTKTGITSLQYGVLRSIAKKKMAFNELARHLSLQPPSILPSVDSLEQHGYIVRRRDPSDRRKVYLVITPKGKKLLERVSTAHRNDSVTKAFRKMSQAKQKQLVALLEEFMKKINN